MYDELGEFFDPGLVLPIGGTGYRVESPTAREGLRLRKLLLTTTLDDKAELAELRQLMGSTFDEMLAAGIKWPEIMHAGRTALLYFGVSPAFAEKHWGADDPGNPLPPKPGANQTSHYPAPTAPTTPAAASSCPSTA